MKKVAVVGVAALALLGAAAVALLAAFPRVGPAAERTVERTPERVERGRYLAHHVTVCVDCHSTRDWTRFSGPVVPGTEGRGGEHFGHDDGFPGDFYAPNITPAAIARYTDGELERIITSGVTKEGRAIFPVMPYPHYAALCADDLDAIVAYVRTLKPIVNKWPKAKLDFPMNFIVKTIPKQSSPPPCPPKDDELARGAYLSNVSGCGECHTPFERGKLVPGQDYAGGRTFALPGGTVRSANLTPDPDTGIGHWTRDVFITWMRSHGRDRADTAPAPEGQFQTVMPWTMYAGMTDADLGAIYTFLRTVPPKRNAVVKWTPAATPGT
jgi:mono/diheme cytochrome c family protein